MVRVVAVVIAVAGVVALLPSTAAAERDFAVRYQENVQGDITGTGNTLLTCRNSDPVCAAARQGTANGGANNNNERFMEWVDIDGDPATFNSSSARLTLPAGAAVRWAGLYYGGRLLAGEGGRPAPNPEQRNRVLLRTSPSRAYRSLRPAVVDTVFADQVDDAQGREYQGFVNVTDIVRARGPGVYTVANVQLGTGLNADQSGGWALAVAYEDSTQPQRNLTIFDGLKFVLAGGPPVDFPVSGFLTPKSGPVRSRLGFIAYEGDLGIVGDSASLDGKVLSNPVNPPTNFFNSTISGFSGVIFSDRTPSYRNTFGLDADIFDASNLLTNNQSSALIRASTAGDGYAPGGASFSTDLFAPQIQPAKTVDKAEADIGEVLTYTVSLANVGLDAAVNTAFQDSIPANTSYVPGSLRVLSGANAGAKTDAADGDQAEFDATGNDVVFRLGAGATGSAGGALPVGATTSLTFQVKIDETGVNSASRVINQGTASFVSDTLNEPGRVTTPEAVTTVRVPDLAITKQHEGGFEAGERTTFQIGVRNVGDAASRGETVVTDTLESEFSFAGTVSGTGWNCDQTGRRVTCRRSDSLAPGSSFPTIRVPVRIDPDAEEDELSNTARVTNPSDGNELNNEATDSGPTKRPDLAIDKQAITDVVFPGDEVDYLVRVTNIGSGRATDVEVRELLRQGLQGLEVIPSQGECRVDVCRLGTVRPGQVVTIQASAFAELDTGGRTLTNTVRVRGRERELNYSNNEDSARVQVLRRADLVVTKATPTPTLAAGSKVSFNVTVINEGPSDATEVRLVDTLPPGLTLISAEPTKGRCAGLVCDIGELRAGGSVQILIEAQSAPAQAGQTFTNRAEATAREPDPTPGNNVAEATVTLTALPPVAADLVVTKTAAPGRVDVGDVVAYRLTAVNRGPATADPAIVTDSVDAGVQVLSAAPTQGTCSVENPIRCDLGALAPGAEATIAVRVRVLVPGILRNGVTAIAPPTDPLTPNNIDTAVVIVQDRSVVQLRKRASRFRLRPGNLVRFAIAATGQGPAVARDVRVCDSLPPGLTAVDLGSGRLSGGRVCWTIDRLEPGDLRTLRFVARAGPVDRSTIVTNVARVTGDNVAPRSARARVLIRGTGSRGGGVTG